MAKQFSTLDEWRSQVSPEYVAATLALTKQLLGNGLDREQIRQKLVDRGLSTKGSDELIDSLTLAPKPQIIRNIRRGNGSIFSRLRNGLIIIAFGISLILLNYLLYAVLSKLFTTSLMQTVNITLAVFGLGLIGYGIDLIVRGK